MPAGVVLCAATLAHSTTIMGTDKQTNTIKNKKNTISFILLQQCGKSHLSAATGEPYGSGVESKGNLAKWGKDWLCDGLRADLENLSLDGARRENS